MMSLMMGLRLALLLSIFPCYFIALTRCRWTTIPLWLVSTSVMLTQYAMSAGQSAMRGGGLPVSALIYAGEMTKILLIPIAVQIAIMLSGMKIRAATDKGPRKLVEALDSGGR